MSVWTVTDRYDAAAAAAGGDEPGIEHHVLEWPTFRAIVRAVGHLRRSAANGVSRQLEDLTEHAATWCRTLAGVPLSPNHPALATEKFTASVRAHRATGLDSAAGALLERLAADLDAVIGENHPACACLEAVISRYGRLRPDDPPAVYVAAEPHQTALVELWLADEELDADVRPVTNLRDTDVRDALILLGPPTRYLSSPWCLPAQASRRAGWLLTAPPARRVHVLTWPGQPRLDIAAATTFPVSTPPAVRTDNRTVSTSATEADAVWLPPVPVEAKVTPAPSWVMDRDPVEAIGLRLAGDAVAFFGRGVTPLPEVVTWDTANVQLLDTEPHRVTIGTSLLFRPARSADDSELHRRADELLAAKHGASAPKAAKEAKLELKTALAGSPLDDERLHYELTSRLNDSGYAHHILHWIPDDGYIAPEKPGAYDAVRSVLRLPPDIGGNRYALLRALRGACRRAGIEITRDLIDVLRTSRDWQAALEADGLAQVVAGPLLGPLDLRVVTAVDVTPRRVGRSRVGRLLSGPARQQETSGADL